MRPMLTTTTGADIAVERIKGLGNIGLGCIWGKISGVTTDGAPAMIGTRVEAVTELTEHAKEQVQVSIGGVSTSGSHEIMRYHCIIHQEALCATAIRFEDVMAAAIKDMNIINPGFVSDVGYLADIINHLNSLNTQLQGKSKNTLDTIASVDAFTKKLTLLKRQLAR